MLKEIGGKKRIYFSIFHGTHGIIDMLGIQLLRILDVNFCLIALVGGGILGCGS